MAKIEIEESELKELKKKAEAHDKANAKARKMEDELEALKKAKSDAEAKLTEMSSELENLKKLSSEYQASKD